MNESLDMLGASIIGGGILLMLLMVSLNFNSKTQETKLSEISQLSIVSVGKILSNDFNKLGYRATGNKILSISSDSISFLGDVNNDGTVDTVTYSTYQQGNELELKRYIGNTQSSSWTFPIKSLAINGVDSTGSSTFTISNIKGISFSILLSQKTFSNSLANVGSYWKRIFYPKNL